MTFNLKNSKILIIDDFPGMRKSVREMLYTSYASDIEEVNSGDSAISAMQRKPYDIVLCDYNLGLGKNGLQILEEVKARKFLSYSALFIMITAEQTPGMVLGAMDNKPDEYLTKPFTTKQLLSRIERNINRKYYLGKIEQERDKGNLPLAIKHCEKLLQSGDRKMHSQLLKLRAELALSAGDYEHAQTIYEDILSQRQINWAELGMGIIHLKQGKIDQAIPQIEKVIAENPLMMEAYDWAAKALIAGNQEKAAEEILHSACQLSPQAILRQQKLAKVAEKNGNLDISTKAYEAAIDLGQHSIYKSAEDFSRLAKIYNSNYSSEKALKVIHRMRSEFNNPESELRAAILESTVFEKMKDFESAGQAFDRAKVLHNQLPNVARDLHLEMAEACYLKEDKESAEKIVDRLIKKHIEDDSFIDAIKTMHRSVGMDNHAESLIKKTRQELIEINNKGVSLYKNGKISEAVELLEQAMKKMPDNKTIILNITKILLHETKASGISKTNLDRIQNYIDQALKLGIEESKIAKVRQEYNKIVAQSNLG